MALLLVCWLLSGNYAGRLKLVFRNKVAMLALAMFCVYAIGVTYSEVPLREAAGVLKMYRKLLYVALFVTVFQDARTRELAIRAFVLSMLVTLVASLLMSWGLVHSKCGTAADCAYFRNRIEQNTMMAFLVAVLANRLPTKPRLRWLYAGLILLTGYNVFVMVDGRTGHLILFALICLFTFQRKGFRGLAWSTALVACLGVSLFVCSSGFRSRTTLAVEEFNDYFRQGRDAPGSSIGQRLLLYKTSLLIAADNPFFGVGTGSFRTEFDKVSNRKLSGAVSWPHNEYFSALTQTGLFGLSVFLYWLYVQWKYSKRLPAEMIPLAQSLVVLFAAGSLVNSLMSQSTTAYFYCYFLGLFYARILPPVADVNVGESEESGSKDDATPA